MCKIWKYIYVADSKAKEIHHKRQSCEETLRARQQQTENNQTEAKMQTVDFAIKNVLTTLEALER